MNDVSLISWLEAGQTLSAPWQSEAGLPPPKKVQVADDTLSADAAYRLVSQGTALLWRGDFHNARQLLLALGRRLEKKSGKGGKAGGKAGNKAGGQAEAELGPRDAFNRHRLTQSQRARLLGMLLIPVQSGYRIPLRRAPEVAAACAEVFGPARGAFVISLRELLGLISAHEWRKKGVELAALGGARIHPHYGVYSPVRGEYLDLVAAAPLPACVAGGGVAFDIGTGTGVLAALLAQRGVAKVVATDMSERALACARENLERLELAGRVELLKADLFPPGKAGLIVCNPPWLPARPRSPIEHAVYDPDSRMLKGFLAGLAAHLEPGGEGWLIISDLAEHLGLRSREELLGWIAAAGLQVLEKHDIRPRHPKASDPDDPLHQARVAEVTSLWRLGLI
ncbi:class I SAM-dependent methyltransferase [Azovibrio restrictus]|uniref:class I SAM-dependent methyltransferase n=1 Tax=Azovibrio restrictus TaxID=146938 RepID=UPI0026E94867|nr:class I SAM-dependent methyltransferase [Azovibrio restrictus]